MPPFTTCYMASCTLMHSGQQAHNTLGSIITGDVAWGYTLFCLGQQSYMSLCFGNLLNCSQGIACHNSAMMIGSGSATLHPKLSMWCLVLQALAMLIVPCTLMLGCIFVACQCKQSGPRKPLYTMTVSVTDIAATLAGKFWMCAVISGL